MFRSCVLTLRARQRVRKGACLCVILCVGMCGDRVRALGRPCGGRGGPGPRPGGPRDGAPRALRALHACQVTVNPPPTPPRPPFPSPSRASPAHVPSARPSGAKCRRITPMVPPVHAANQIARAMNVGHGAKGTAVHGGASGNTDAVRPETTVPQICPGTSGPWSAPRIRLLLKAGPPPPGGGGCLGGSGRTPP